MEGEIRPGWGVARGARPAVRGPLNIQLVADGFPNGSGVGFSANEGRGALGGWSFRSRRHFDSNAAWPEGNLSGAVVVRSGRHGSARCFGGAAAIPGKGRSNGRSMPETEDIRDDRRESRHAPNPLVSPANPFTVAPVQALPKSRAGVLHPPARGQNPHRDRDQIVSVHLFEARYALFHIINLGRNFGPAQFEHWIVIRQATGRPQFH